MMNTATPVFFVEQRQSHPSNTDATKALHCAPVRSLWARNAWRNAPTPALVGTWGRSGR